MNQPILDPNQVTRFPDAYQHLVDEIRSVPECDLVTIDIDIPSAATTALDVLPEIRALRSRIVAELPEFDLERFDKLETYTLAVAHAHALYLAASQPSEALEQLSEAAIDVREMLISDVTALAQGDLIDGDRLQDLKGVTVYRNIAFDLFALATLLREAWPRIAGKTALRLNEIDQAETLADRILTAVGQREEGPAAMTLSAEYRQRAFSLFVSAYDDARRAVIYLRWDENADDIAPSLYAVDRSVRRETAIEVYDEEPATTPQGAAMPTNGAAMPSPMGLGLPESEPFFGG